MLTTSQESLLIDTLGAMGHGPRPMETVLRALAAQPELVPSGTELAEHISSCIQDDPALNRLRASLVAWDAVDAPWTEQTLRNTRERRDRVYELIGAAPELRKAIDDRLPYAPWQRPILIAVRHSRWYDDQVQSGRDFYWSRYRDYLEKVRGFRSTPLQQLGEDTTLVVERLADPRQPEAYQSKGLVVGYVQSGKTANFTGVIAKAIDTGYRLVIVLSGVTNLLRRQTQRRVDMELVGKEQIRPNEEVDSEFDYADDPHWDRFITYGQKPVDIGGVEIIRLTGAGSQGDFRSLKHGIKTLEFEKRDRSKPLYDAANLPFAGCRLVVLKKNATVLKRLVKDIKRIGTAAFSDVPALVIDDESDQASVNTNNPQKKGGRSTVNARIGDLLRLLPRGQYVGYTATPFANVFVDPEDGADIFPKDFIHSLRRPNGYTGISDFHDLDRVFERDEDKTIENSNEAAYVRGIPRKRLEAERRHEDPDPDRLQEALDSFVLTGALKLFRARHKVASDFTHHTMLVHESQYQRDQSATQTRVDRLWSQAGYEAGNGVQRLRALYNQDFGIVSRHHATDLPFPARFEDLIGDLGEAIRRIEANEGPAYVVNGSDEANDPDFDTRNVWKILIGGAKLSRGYTVEGLTISYFRRRSNTTDTLMQMGRWFGFRAGYRDLIRLYIGREEALDKTGRQHLDLYEAFESTCRDEEAFRQQLERYAYPADGSEPITPKDIPPLVLNSHPRLKPTSKNKMFNAILLSQNFGGQWIERARLLDTDIAHNKALLTQLLEAHAFLVGDTTVTTTQRITFGACVGIVGHTTVLEFLTGYRWADRKELKLALEYLKGKDMDPKVDDWAVILPQIQSGDPAPWVVSGRQLMAVQRTRIEGRFKAFSDPNHRAVAEIIAGHTNSGQLSGEFGRGFIGQRRGAILIYPTFERHNATRPVDPHVGLAILPPDNGGVPLAHFSVRRPSKSDEAIVSV